MTFSEWLDDYEAECAAVPIPVRTLRQRAGSLARVTVWDWRLRLAQWISPTELRR